jgi:hypothetical protein
MNILFPFRPKLADALKGYSSKDFLADLVAGITVARRHPEGRLLTEPGGFAMKRPLVANKI